jgi:hypothetical protein
MTWLAIVSTAIGVDHIQVDKPCQDSANYKIVDDRTIIGVVSDGMGSAKHSDLGSKLAVEGIISDLSLLGWDWETQPVNQDFFKLRFERAVENLKLKLKSEARKYKACLDDFACTLLVFVATPSWLAAMQIGDGFIVIRPKNGSYRLVFQPTKGEFFNETESVTSQNALQELNFYFKEIELQFICAATDGIENISLDKEKQRGWHPSAKFFSPLEEHMLSNDGREQKEVDLDKFLNSNKINSSTKDDKALLICLFQTELIDQNIDSAFSRSRDPNLKSTHTSFEESQVIISNEINNQSFLFCKDKQHERECEYSLTRESYEQLKIRAIETLKTEIGELYLMPEDICFDGQFVDVFFQQKKILFSSLDREEYDETKQKVRLLMAQLFKVNHKCVRIAIKRKRIYRMLDKLVEDELSFMINTIFSLVLIICVFLFFW